MNPNPVPKLVRASLIAATILLPSAPVHAAITVADWWRMGENDSSVTIGNATTNTVDSVGNKNLALAKASYAAPTGSSAVAAVGSTTCILFTNQPNSFGSQAMPGTTDNFGIEMWVKPAAVNSGNQCLAYNGNTAANGWGLYILGSRFGILYGGVAFLTNSATVTPNQWTHVALIRDGTSTVLLVNGVTNLTSTAAPNTPSGNFGVASSPTDSAADDFTGMIDEIRYFTFSQGQFSPTNLLYNDSEPYVRNAAATGLTGASATLNGQVGPNGLDSSYYFVYGPTASYGSYSPTNTLAGASGITAVSYGINGLTMGATYHYSLVASNQAGVDNNGDAQFTEPGPPVVVSQSSGGVTTSVQLSGTANPEGLNCTAYFAYGLDTTYGLASSSTGLGSGDASVNFNSTISSLLPGCVYHYAVALTGSFGTFYGPDATFTTPGTASATVQTINDDGSANSLRQLVFNCANGGTINFGVVGNLVLTNALVIQKSININGPGSGSLAINAYGTNRIFFVDAGPGNAVNINNLTLANGLAQGGGGGAAQCAGGGGLGAGGALFVNSGATTLSNIVFSGNRAVGGGGGGVTDGQASAGGGGGLDGAGGVGTFYGAGGGGGFEGTGGLGEGEFPEGDTYGTSDGGGGGGMWGAGGEGENLYGGGGGGAFGSGGVGNPNTGISGAGGAGGGGAGSGGAGALFGGGGGGTYSEGVTGGAGGRYGGGGGSSEGAGQPNNFLSGNGGNGGDFGGGGGSVFLSGSASTQYGGNGGFGAGGGGAFMLIEGGGGSGGNGGFGAGAGGSAIDGSGSGGSAVGGAYGGSSSTDGGGGGAALGGVIFLRGTNSASLTLVNTSIETGAVTAGGGSGGAGNGQAAGSSLFGLGGVTYISVPGGVTNTISGSIADYPNKPIELLSYGAGTLVISSTNSYIGETAVEDGTLRVTGNIASSSNIQVMANLDVKGQVGNVTLVSGGYMGGTGTASNVSLDSGGYLGGIGSMGTLNWNSGGVLTPGLSNLTCGNVVASGTVSYYNWQLYNAQGTADSGYSTINVNGTLNVSNDEVEVNLWSLSAPGVNGKPVNFPSLTGGSWTLFTTTGGVQGFNPSKWSVVTNATSQTGGFSSPLTNLAFQVSQSGNNVILTPVTQPFLTGSAVVAVTASNATLTAQANAYNAAASLYFEWGPTASYGSTNVLSIGSGGSSTNATNLISSLLPNEVYHWQIVASNSMGSTNSGDHTLTTAALPPVATTLPAGNIFLNGGTVNGSVNTENAATGWYFEYGPTTSYGSTTPVNVLSAGTATVAVSNTISGLTANTPYHYALVATNSAGVTTGADMTFTPTGGAPALTLMPVKGITASNATLNAVVTPNGAGTTVYFEWGTSASYTHTNTLVMGNGTSPSPVSDAVSNLSSYTVYHYQIVASNLLGEAASGDQTFITASGALNILNWWRMGEADPLAAPGAVATNTVDSQGNENLTILNGGARYSTNVSTTAVSSVNSSLSIDFGSGISFASNVVPATVISNFGFDLWVYPTNISDSPTILYNGNPGASGWGIGATGGSYRILLGDVVFFNVGAVTLNTWTHLAVVCQNGAAALYTNGILAGSTSAIPIVPSGSFAIGGDPGGGNYFQGLIDEVRIFTFAGGTFSPTNLLYNAPDSPSVSGLTASDITTNQATLSANVTPNSPSGGGSQFWIEFGPTSNYGLATATNSVPAGPAQQTIFQLAGLQPATVYHYRMDYMGAESGLQSTPDATFVTLDIPRSISAAFFANGQFTLGFTGSSNITYTVLTSTNLALPLSNWTILGSPTGVNNQFQFSDINATNAARYYMIK